MSDPSLIFLSYVSFQPLRFARIYSIIFGLVFPSFSKKKKMHVFSILSLSIDMLCNTWYNSN